MNPESKKQPMPLNLSTEELLRADLVTARSFLDAVCEAIANNQLTKEERKLIHAAARSRYAIALRRFSSWVVDGKAPPDLR
jgi:hypothetical protein